MPRIFVSLMLMIASCSFSFSQAATDVKIRVLDYKTGKAVKRWKIELFTGDKAFPSKTAKDGIALFQVPKPLPRTLSVNPEAGWWDQWSCTDTREFQTSEVLQAGVVGKISDNRLCHRHATSTATAKPGEIVIYTRRLNPWLTFRRVLWETFYG